MRVNYDHTPYLAGEFDDCRNLVQLAGHRNSSQTTDTLEPLPQSQTCRKHCNQLTKSTAALLAPQKTYPKVDPNRRLGLLHVVVVEFNALYTLTINNMNR